MYTRTFTTFIAVFLFSTAFTQPIIYKDAQTIVTGTWASSTGGGTATIQEITGSTPHEGTKHYKFDYNYSNWWAGCGLNMDNWGTGAAKDLSGYTHLRLAYRGLSGSQELKIQVRNGSNLGNEITVGNPNTSYVVVDIPMTALTNSSPVSVNAVREIQFSIGGVQVSSGTVYLDAIELINSSGTGSSSPASAATWARANSVTRGVNTANWLEAHWLIPFNAFPETSKYSRATVAALKNAGFQAFRLPITFERITPTTAPYTVNFSHQALKLVDSMIVWANEMDFKLIIDNHHGYELTDANYAAELPRLNAIWAQLATRYGSLDPNRYLFEVYNEAHAISNANLRTVFTSLVSTVRANESQVHSILIGASGYNSGGSLTAFSPLADADIIYTFHNYDPYYFTHQGMSWTSPAYFAARTFPLAGEVDAINSLFSSVKSWSTTYNVPVWLGEYGASTAADASSRCNWVDALATATINNGFAHFYWDALSPSDAFGFYTGGVVSSTNVITCFANEIGLYSGILPIEYVDINVECTTSGAEINWEASASAATIFKIESSQNGLQWTDLAETEAKEGNFFYQFLDDKSSTFYRIKSTDFEGNSSYSPVVHVPCAQPKQNIVVFPNPAVSSIQIQWEATEADNLDLEIYSISGKLVRKNSNYTLGSPLNVQDLIAGQYFLQGRFPNGAIWRERLVVGE